MFNFFKKTLSNIYNHFTNKIGALFKSNKIDQDTLNELEKILITSDTGVSTTKIIVDKIKDEFKNGNIKSGTDLRDVLAQELKGILTKNSYDSDVDIYLLVGINGSGKTTFAGKLSSFLKYKNKKVLLVAADTFRAAAREQLGKIAQKLDVDIIEGQEGQDPASVVYLGCQEYKKGNYDSLIIDTAGRLQTKTNLMKELEKIKKTINKQLPDKKISVLLTIDSMLGQNSLDQAKIFNESTVLNGIILTKMDGTGKGGIVFAITRELNIPIAFISFGEKLDEVKLFNAQEYVDELLAN